MHSVCRVHSCHIELQEAVVRRTCGWVLEALEALHARLTRCVPPAC